MDLGPWIQLPDSKIRAIYESECLTSESGCVGPDTQYLDLVGHSVFNSITTQNFQTDATGTPLYDGDEYSVWRQV